MQALSGIIDQVTTLEERLDGFSDNQAHMGERLVTLEGVVKGNMATLLDQVAELSSKSQSSSQSQQRTGSSNNYNKGKNGGYQARSGGDQGHGQSRSGGVSTGGASSFNPEREYHRPRNNGDASSSSRFQGRWENLKCFLCGGNHKANQCSQKTALSALMASQGDQANEPLREMIAVKLIRPVVDSVLSSFTSFVEEHCYGRSERGGLSTTNDTGSGRGLSTTKAGGPFQHNSFLDPEPEYKGFLELNGRGLDPRRFGPFVDDDVPQSNDSFETIRTDVPP
ncbi:hypothetical protein GIB67_021715 [Kingdonia uniflora]|uniref:Uncharacterized protein n=1 Tax=Kingdonia uniflora TaxID=39325 RepID=A0A7J7LM08_9MAGN|nr:hypothetical protein GIB67_021715 [Kingdonia uniflora]